MIRTESEVNSDEDVDEWLNEELSKRLTRQDKKEEEDALINILKIGVSFVAENEKGDSSETLPYRQPSNEINAGSFTLPCTIGNLNIYAMTDVGVGINMMPKSLFEHLKLTNFKETCMDVKMGDMTKKAPLEIVEKIRGEILLEVGNEKVKFDVNGEICHSRVPFEKIYMTSSIQKSKYFNPHENNDSPALEQRTFHYREESIGTVDSSSDSKENEIMRDRISGENGMKFDDFIKVRYENKNIDNITRERDSMRRVMFKEWVKEDFNFGVNIGWTNEDPYSRNFDVYKDEFDKEIEQLVNEYDLKAGSKRHALEEVCEKCEKFHDSTKQWYGEGFEEEKLLKSIVTHSRMGKAS
ncbi:phospholipase-like protein [Tanacetum coccineum]